MQILVIDDEEKITGVLARMLEREGHEVARATTPDEGLALLGQQPFDVVLCDLRMPGMSGIEVLDRAKQIRPTTDFVMMTAYAEVATAVESMKKGALDYLIKPFPFDELKLLLKRIEETRHLKEENERLRDVIRQKFSIENIVAVSRAMRDVLERARKVAAANSSVLLHGESGTGKEVLAKAIHLMSPRASGPLIVVNCGAVPESLMESEFFGHVKGSFTGAIETRKGMFESAHGGTIFLDEIGEVPLHLQVKLLRVLQEGEIQRVGDSVPRKVDVRVIAATNRNLEAEVAAGRFRQDLYYRLNVIPIYIPPLRERREDIPPLIEHFLKKYAQGATPKRLSREAFQLLMRYDYPGNIRELENAIEHAVVLSEGEEIQPADLPIQIQNASQERPLGHEALEQWKLEDLEKQAILVALEKTRYNFTRAATHLGITRRTLGYRIKKYGLEEQIAEKLKEVRRSRANES